MKRYFSVLLAVFVFVLGMAGSGTAGAAKVTADEVSRMITVKPRNSNETKSAPIKMHVMLENIDLHVYAKYTAELRKNAKYGSIVFAKAAPGSQISITAEAGVVPGIVSKLVKDMNYSETVNYYNHKKIETSKDLLPVGKVNGFGKKHTIPKDVEEVTAYVAVTYHNIGMEVGKDMKTSTGTYRQEPAVQRQYYIFTSDKACEKAYKLLTGNSSAGSAGSTDTGTKKSTAKGGNEKDKTTASSQKDSGESGGFGTAGKIGIGVVAAGAIGFGASRLFGKGRGGGGAGAPGGSALSHRTGDNRNPAAETTQVVKKAADIKGKGSPVVTAPADSVENAERQSATQNFCKNCGAELSPGSRFCERCGARNAPAFCTNCGAKLEPGSVFCGNCGTKV